MKPAWKILVGDVLAKLRELGDEHFQTVVTSPPYWGLRDYGVEGQIGLEATPEEFVDALVEVFAEVQRVMRPDGTLWVNMGDSYCAAPAGNAPGEFSTSGLTNPKRQNALHAGLNKSPRRDKAARARKLARRALGGHKPKDLIGQPWLLAFALRDRLGLYLRAEIIWHKRSVMPESITDRPTRAHEQVFLFAKSERYFYDADAVREKGDLPAGTRAAKGSSSRRDGAGGAVNGRPAEYATYSGTRNKRTVWTLGPEPSSLAHFATFPTKLVEPCILAGTSERGACPGCGSPWRRVKAPATGGSIGQSWHDHSADAETGNFKTASSEGYEPGKTIGWEATCDCGSTETVPCSVLDPFAGTATTGVVALKYGRSFCGIELNPTYAEFARKRLAEADAEHATPLFDAGPAGVTA
jgi:DNA modification methylase